MQMETKMTRLLLGLAAVMALVPGARAADIPYAKAPAAAAAYNWSGAYVGAHGGAFYGRDTVTTPGGELTGPISIHDGSWFAGGTVGYNVQLSRFVLGVEGDFSWVLGGRALSARQQTVVPGVFAASDSDPQWLATLAARFGIALDNWLIYGKAGGAWMKADYTAVVTTGAGAVLATETHGATRSGWLIGGGLEYGWTRNLSTRIEYNYLDLGTRRVAYTFAGINAADYDTTAHVVKLGLAYRFGSF
jgi:outer membrane immunogenic protein